MAANRIIEPNMNIKPGGRSINPDPITGRREIYSSSNRVNVIVEKVEGDELPAVVEQAVEVLLASIGNLHDPNSPSHLDLLPHFNVVLTVTQPKPDDEPAPAAVRSASALVELDDDEPEGDQPES